MKRFLHMALALLCVASCEIPFELDQAGEPQFYLQCFAEDDQITVLPQYAAPVMGGEATPLQDLEMELQVNDEKLTLTADGEGRYVAYRPELCEGDQLWLQLRARGLETASGSTIVPRRPRVLDMSLQRFQVDTIDATQVRITLDRAPQEGNYFAVRILREDSITLPDDTRFIQPYYLTPGYILTAAESAQFDLADFVQLNYDSRSLGGEEYMPITLLTHKQFDGPVYSFYLNSYDSSILQGIRDSMPQGDTGMAGGGIVSGEVGGVVPGLDFSDAMHTEYFITLYALSADFYFYARALYQSNFDFLANMGLIPANFTWSNVDGGLGFVGALQGTTLGPFELPQEN